MSKHCFLIPVKKDFRVIDRVSKLLKSLKKHNLENFEILIIKDDHLDFQFDCELEHLDSVKIIKNPGKIGKGSSVKYGLSKSKSDIICVIDSDNSLSTEDIVKACLNYQKGTFLYGLRIFDNSTEKIRRILGILQNFLANLISLDYFIQDTQCPLKVMDNKIAEILLDNLTVSGGMYDVQQFRIVQKKKIDSIVHPIIRVDEERSILRLRRIIFRDLIDLFRIRFTKIT